MSIVWEKILYNNSLKKGDMVNKIKTKTKTKRKVKIELGSTAYTELINKDITFKVDNIEVTIKLSPRVSMRMIQESFNDLGFRLTLDE